MYLVVNIPIYICFSECAVLCNGCGRKLCVCCRRHWSVTPRTRMKQESCMNILLRHQSCFRRCFQSC